MHPCEMRNGCQAKSPQRQGFPPSSPFCRLQVTHLQPHPPNTCDQTTLRQKSKLNLFPIAQYRGTITSLVMEATLLLIQMPKWLWPFLLPGHMDGSYPAGCQSAPTSPFLLRSSQATLPQAFTTAWDCHDLKTRLYWTSCCYPQLINPVLQDFSTDPSYPSSDQHSHPTWWICELIEDVKYWVQSVNLLRMHSTPSSRSSREMLKMTGCNIEPWNKSSQWLSAELVPYTTTHWTSKFFAQQRLHLSKLYYMKFNKK